MKRDVIDEFLTHNRWSYQAAQRAAIFDSIERLARCVNPQRGVRFIQSWESLPPEHSVRTGYAPFYFKLSE